MKTFTYSLVALSLSILPAGCSDGNPNTDDTSPSIQMTSKQTSPQSSSETKSEQGDCDLFTREELTAAFADKLEFGKLTGFRGRGSSCTVSIEGYEGEFILQAESREAFETRRDTYIDYEKQGSAKVMSVDVGSEAYLVNNAQVIAIDTQGRALNVALQLFVFDGELPITREESAEGVQAIARKALTRL